MSQVFASTINSNPIYAKRTYEDKNGVSIDSSTYILPSNVPAAQKGPLSQDLSVDRTSLFSSATGASGDIIVSELASHFEMIEVIYGNNTTSNSSIRDYDRGVLRFYTNPVTYAVILEAIFKGDPSFWKLDDVYWAFAVYNSLDTLNWTRSANGYRPLNRSTVVNASYIKIFEVVGIHRIVSAS